MSNGWRFNILIIQYLNIETDSYSKNDDTEDDDEGDNENSFNDTIGNQKSYDDDVVNSEGEDVNEETNE